VISNEVQLGLASEEMRESPREKINMEMDGGSFGHRIV
jgi:hypothetical protein